LQAQAAGVPYYQPSQMAALGPDTVTNRISSYCVPLALLVLLPVGCNLKRGLYNPFWKKGTTLCRNQLQLKAGN
jgi:hypothetical protein